MISSFQAIDGCASASTTHDGVSDKLNTIQVFVGVVGGPLRATRVPSDVTPRDLAAFLHLAEGIPDHDLKAISGLGRVLPTDTPLGAVCEGRDITVRFTGRLRGGADGGGGAAATTPVADDIAKAKARAEGHRSVAEAAAARATVATDPVEKQEAKAEQYEAEAKQYEAEAKQYEDGTPQKASAEMNKVEAKQNKAKAEMNKAKAEMDKAEAKMNKAEAENKHAAVARAQAEYDAAAKLYTRSAVPVGPRYPGRLHRHSRGRRLRSSLSRASTLPSPSRTTSNASHAPSCARARRGNAAGRRTRGAPTRTSLRSRCSTRSRRPWRGC